MKNKKPLTRCCILLAEQYKTGDFSGKHILLDFGVTLCGMPTIDYDMSEFPALANMASEYKIVEWDITCERCLDMVGVIEQNKINK